MTLPAGKPPAVSRLKEGGHPVATLSFIAVSATGGSSTVGSPTIGYESAVSSTGGYESI